ncbi:unnamed protein product, partial [Closterium sp. Naga37s-1]
NKVVLTEFQRKPMGAAAVEPKSPGAAGVEAKSTLLLEIIEPNVFIGISPPSALRHLQSASPPATTSPRFKSQGNKVLPTEVEGKPMGAAAVEPKSPGTAGVEAKSTLLLEIIDFATIRFPPFRLPASHHQTPIKIPK